MKYQKETLSATDDMLFSVPHANSERNFWEGCTDISVDNMSEFLAI